MVDLLLLRRYCRDFGSFVFGAWRQARWLPMLVYGVQSVLLPYHWTLSSSIARSRRLDTHGLATSHGILVVLKVSIGLWNSRVLTVRSRVISGNVLLIFTLANLISISPWVQLL